MPSSSSFRMTHKSYWTILAPSQGNFLTNNASPFSPTFISRSMRYLRSAYYSNHPLLPLSMTMNVTTSEFTVRSNPNHSSNLSKLFLGYFTAALTLFQILSSSPSSSQDPPPLFGAAMAIAFSVSLSGIFLSQFKPRLAFIIERAGFFCFTIGILLMMINAFLSGPLVFKVIGLLAGASPMLAFLMSCVL